MRVLLSITMNYEYVYIMCLGLLFISFNIHTLQAYYMDHRNRTIHVICTMISTLLCRHRFYKGFSRNLSVTETRRVLCETPRAKIL